MGRVRYSKSSAHVLRSRQAELDRLASRFALWRRSRTVGTRIPDRLWQAAVQSVRTHGLSRTALALKLGYYALKKRFEKAAKSTEDEQVPNSHAGFVELPSAAWPHAAECVIEFENLRGDRLRVSLRGHAPPELGALGRSLLGRR